MTAIRLKTDSYKEAIQNKNLLDIIDEIISSYPITYINLERIRVRTNELEEMFWIKDEDGKYLFVNKNFAACLGLLPSQIEGKSVESFIPAYLISFNRALDSYIKETRNTFIVEGFSLSGLPVSENYQTIEIPVTGSEGNVIAVICIAQKSRLMITETNEKLQSSLSLIKSLNHIFVYIDENGIVKDISDEFCIYYSLNKSVVINSPFEKSLPSLISLQIRNFTSSGKEYDNIEIKSEQNNQRLHLVKIVEQDRQGTVIIVIDKDTKEFSEIMNSDSKILDILIQNNPDPVFIYDKENLHFLYVNRTALSLYGYSRDEFLQLDLTDLYAPEDIQTLLDTSEDKSKEDFFSKPYCHIKKDGSSVFVEISRVSIKYNNRDAFYNITRNITEKLKLAKEAQQFTSAFENTRDLFFITDRDGFIKSVNRSVVEELGYSPKSLEETSFASLVAEDDRGKINTTIFQKNIKEKISHKTQLKKAGNEYVNVELIFIPIFNYRNEVESYNMIAKTETKVKEVIKEVPSENVSDNVMPDTNFLSEVFHELLTPINVILGFVQELTENINNPTEEQKEAAEIINQNRISLLDLMNSLIEFNKLLKNQFDVKPESIKITDIIESLSKEINYESAKEIELAYGKISSSLKIITDGQKFKQLINLLLKIASALSGEKKIYFSAANDNENFIINLRDSYSGISQKLLNKLNEIFGQKEALTHHEYGVPPINIRLCKGLLEVLGGKFKIIEENNKRDAGFVFPINLEQWREKPEFAVVADKREESKSADVVSEEIQMEHTDEEFLDEKKEEKTAGYQQSFIDLSQLSCLYIEDQIDSQTLFSVQMKDLKEIRFANDFEKALPILQESQFDFIVVDINLPGDYNGLDILKILRRMPGYESVPVIAVTAFLLPGDSEKFIRAGFNDFIAKPVLIEKLLISLEKLFMPQT